MHKCAQIEALCLLRRTTPRPATVASPNCCERGVCEAEKTIRQDQIPTFCCLHPNLVNLMVLGGCQGGSLLNPRRKTQPWYTTCEPGLHSPSVVVAKCAKTSKQQSNKATNQPSNQPTKPPSDQPSNQAAKRPTKQPSNPTKQPSNQATNQATKQPSNQATKQPSNQATKQPTDRPTNQPTNQPSVKPRGGGVCCQRFKHRGWPFPSCLGPQSG